MKETLDGFVLSSGREFYANNGLVSIRRNVDGSFELAEGYDGTIALEPEWPHPDGPWTADERVELAEHMIQLWEAFKAASK